MKWFFALNENGADYPSYARMVKVAVFTAQKFTRLEPHFLYDGAENDLTEWLTARGVRIHRLRSFLFDNLAKIAEQRNDPNFLKIGAGAFLRTEIPRLTAELKFPDEFVLYTDIDVMFQTDISDALEKYKPRYFAVAPENIKNDYRGMNTGVMIMNLPNLRRFDDKFREFMTQKLDVLVDNAWDQGAYKLHFKGKFYGFQWDKLPHEFNWKPYWDENPAAKIIHFHGPKAHQRAGLTETPPAPHCAPLLPFVVPGYHFYCDVWDAYEKEINSPSNL